jgi:hypothetical protein
VRRDNTDHVLCSTEAARQRRRRRLQRYWRKKVGCPGSCDKLQAETKAADLKKAQEKAQVCLPLAPANNRRTQIKREYAKAALQQWPWSSHQCMYSVLVSLSVFDRLLETSTARHVRAQSTRTELLIGNRSHDARTRRASVACRYA